MVYKLNKVHKLKKVKNDKYGMDFSEPAKIVAALYSASGEKRNALGNVSVSSILGFIADL